MSPREEEVENPGDYLAFRIMGEPVLVVRDQEGALNAFANVCLHRGVEVAHGQGTAKQFSCPYHGWRYGLDGRLAGASFMEHAEGFDPENCRLAPLRIGVWARNVFISFDPEVLPLADFVAPWEHDFGFLRQEDCRLGNKVVVELDCNWKFASENLMDFYHVGVLHVNTFGAKFAVTDDDVTTKEKGGLSIFYKAAAPVPGGQSLFGKMPWLSDQLDSFACTGYLAPNLHISAASIASARSSSGRYRPTAAAWCATTCFRRSSSHGRTSPRRARSITTIRWRCSRRTGR